MLTTWLMLQVALMQMKSVTKEGRLEIRDTRKNSIVFRSGFLIHVTVHPRFRFAS